MNFQQKSQKVTLDKQQKLQKLSLDPLLPFSPSDFHTLSISDQGMRKNASFRLLLKQGVRFLSIKECLNNSLLFPRDFLQILIKNTQTSSQKKQLVLYFPKNFRSDKALCLLWGNQEPQALTLFLAAKSQIEVLNCAPNNTKQTCRFYLAPDAQLYHLHLSGIQADTQATLKSNSRYHLLHYFCPLENSSLSEHQLSFLLQGQKSSARVVCLYSLQKTQKALVKIQQQHTHKNSFSSVHCSSVLHDQAQLDFSGKIAIPKQATQTQAFLYNTNLLLSEKATVHARPQLEIQNSDLECKHGFTSSPIDKETLFYLKSRGLIRQEAEDLIAQGFLNSKAQTFAFPQTMQNILDVLLKKLC